MEQNLQIVYIYLHINISMRGKLHQFIMIVVFGLTQSIMSGDRQRYSRIVHSFIQKHTHTRQQKTGPKMNSNWIESKNTLNLLNSKMTHQHFHCHGHVTIALSSTFRLNSFSFSSTVGAKSIFKYGLVLCLYALIWIQGLCINFWCVF